MTIGIGALVLAGPLLLPGVAASSVGAGAGTVAVGTATGTGVATTAVAGGATASAGAATGTAVSVGLSLGPIGWIALGTEHNKETKTVTFDCWKPVLHDKSPEPSNGKLLKDVLADPRIKNVIVNDKGSSAFPEIILHNIWDEQFTIQGVILPSKEVFLHAHRIN